MNPLLRYTLAFAFGILILNQWPVSSSTLFISGILLAIFWLLVFVRFRHRFLLGGITLIVFIYLGGLATVVKNASLSPNHLTKITPSSITAYRGLVESFPETRAKTHRIVLRVTHVQTKEQWIEATGKVQLYIDKQAQRPAFGAKMIVLGAPKAVEAPTNPNQFDFRQFLAYKQIYHQHYLRSSDFGTTGKNAAPWYMLLPYHLSEWSDHTLKKAIPYEREYAIAKAMLLGLRDDMEPELTQAYSAAGAIHVLSVSGFHIGVFVAIIAFLLQKLKTDRRGRWLYLGLTFGILWFYAILTGLSAPVVRSALMFSLFLLAEPLGKKPNGENALFGSALVLLAYDPLLIYSVSFQLSYAALAGIVFWQPTVYQWFSFNDWLVDKLWGLTAVALTAQLATFPLTVYYFHQFPTYFLLANPIVVALSTALIPIALAALALTNVPFLGAVFGWIITGVTWLLNQSVVWIEQLPHSTLNGLSFTPVEVGIVYGIMGTLIIGWYQRELFWLRAAFTLSIIFAIVQGVNGYQHQTQKWLVIHDVPKQTVISLIDGPTATILADSSFFSAQTSSYSFYLKNFYDVHGIRHIKYLSLEASPDEERIRRLSFGKVVVWNGQKMLLLEQPTQALPPQLFNQVIARKGVLKSLIANTTLHSLPLVFDGSSPRFYLDRLRKNRQPTWYFTHENGALIHSF